MEMLGDPCTQSASGIMKEDSKGIRKLEDADRADEARLGRRLTLVQNTIYTD